MSIRGRRVGPEKVWRAGGEPEMMWDSWDVPPFGAMLRRRLSTAHAPQEPIDGWSTQVCCECNNILLARFHLSFQRISIKDESGCARIRESGT